MHGYKKTSEILTWHVELRWLSFFSLFFSQYGLQFSLFFISWIAEVWPWLSTAPGCFSQLRHPKTRNFCSPRSWTDCPWKGYLAVSSRRGKRLPERSHEVGPTTSYFNGVKKPPLFLLFSRKVTYRGPHFTLFITIVCWAHLVGPKDWLIHHPCFFLAQFSNEEPSTWPPSCVDRIPMSHI